MKRRTFDEDAPLPPHGHLPPDDRLPCQWCNAPTPGVTLALYGARCHSCYEAYCHTSRPAPAWMADKRAEGPLAWAHALKAREESGERLSWSVRAMWRAALRDVVTGDAT